MKTKLDYLRHYFGYHSFRSGQDVLIDATLSGRDSLGVMPTGGGKSICYQIPALMLSGLTVVISPLISLMKDQVAALTKAGIPAAYLNSTVSREEYLMTLDALEAGVVKLLYLAPERLDTDSMARLSGTLDISFVAIDEAHCISQWGQDFRPSYLRIADFIDSLPVRPTVAAFTATATERVREDIIEKLRLHAPIRVVTGFDRPNLNFEVRMPASKLTELERCVSERRNQCGIIYCGTRKLVESVCLRLQKSGYSATRYHAGLDAEERRKNQEDFIYDRATIMVATNAFGMGIDKSNVSYVIHFNMPKSIEDYYQEAGRAGRDGSAADCILLFSNSDIIKVKQMIQNPTVKEELSEEELDLLLKKNYALLDQMVAYCKSTHCLRGHLLQYFGQAHEERCENCGNCRSRFVEEDVTVDAQKVMSCVKRASTALGYPVGRTMIAKILQGSKDKKVLSLGLDMLSTYGIMANTSAERVNNLIARLVDLDMIRIDPEFGGTSLTNKAYPVLFGKEKLIMSFKEPPLTQKARKKSGRKAEEVSCDEELYELLRTLRYEVASEEQVPAYIVFTNSTLRDMAVKKPKTFAEFLEVSGVGHTKAEKYSEMFIKAILNYENK